MITDDSGVDAPTLNKDKALFGISHYDGPGPMPNPLEHSPFLGEEPLDIATHPVFSKFTPKDWALTYITLYGGIDGDHHKQWVLDQVARLLMGTPVTMTIARWENGLYSYRFNTGKPSHEYRNWYNDIEESGYAWEEGVAP